MDRERSGSRYRRLLLTIATVVLGVLALAVALDLATSSPRLCMSCHEMTSRAGMWKTSEHVSVKCVRCHQPVRPWYDVPGRLADRGRLLARDLRAHRGGEYEGQVETRTARAEPIADSVCLQCHDANRKATSGYRILIDHAAHAKRNGSCVSCHIRTAHPQETRGKALALMAQCFTCHGTAGQPKASARCAVCHPAGYELKPASHSAPRWGKGRHGGIAKSDVGLCGMCHQQATCDSCHGIRMPHPDGWPDGRTGHGPVAKADPGTCKRCHSGQPDMCSMCHHTKFQPARGTWIEQHNLQVREDGAAFCMDCHGALDCVECHIGRKK